VLKQAITSSNAPQAVGPYSPGIQLGDFVYLSGQIPLDPNTGDLVAGGIKEQTKQVLKNIEAVLSELGLETRHIVKTTVFMTDLSEFSIMNEEYASFFEEPYPARSAVQVAALPKNAKVEIECLVINTLAYETSQCGCCSQQDCGEEGCGGCPIE